MARFYFERSEIVTTSIRNEYYDDAGIIDDNEHEEVLYFWAIYDGREGHIEPIGYMKTADQAQMICDALNH